MNKQNIQIFYLSAQKKKKIFYSTLPYNEVKFTDINRTTIFQN